MVPVHPLGVDHDDMNMPLLVRQSVIAEEHIEDLETVAVNTAQSLLLVIQNEIQSIRLLLWSQCVVVLDL